MSNLYITDYLKIIKENAENEKDKRIMWIDTGDYTSECEKQALESDIKIFNKIIKDIEKIENTAKNLRTY